MPPRRRAAPKPAPKKAAQHVREKRSRYKRGLGLLGKASEYKRQHPHADILVHISLWEDKIGNRSSMTFTSYDSGNVKEHLRDLQNEYEDPTILRVEVSPDDHDTYFGKDGSDPYGLTRYGSDEPPGPKPWSWGPRTRLALAAQMNRQMPRQELEDHLQVVSVDTYYNGEIPEVPPTCEPPPIEAVNDMLVGNGPDDTLRLSADDAIPYALALRRREQMAAVLARRIAPPRTGLKKN